MSINASGLTDKIKAVRLLILDVDGVLTDGSIVYTLDGAETKTFNVKDGHGIKLLIRAGIEVAMITARESKVVALRAKDLGVTDLYQGQKEKLKAFNEIISAKGLRASKVAYMGDDLIDMPVMSRVGLSIAVADAVEEVRAMADLVTEARGGRGAVRQAVELILKAQNKWTQVTERYAQ